MESDADYSTGVHPAGPGGVREPLSLAARLEALLFMAPGPTGIAQLAGALEVTPRRVERALQELEATYVDRGLRLQRSPRGVQLTTAPEAARDVERFLELETTVHLSQAALEVLAIVAYKQPVTRPQVDAIRGVNSESSMRTLLRYGLIEEVGRSEGPGRPILYATSNEFLQEFGLACVEDLPALEVQAEGEKEDHGSA